MRNSQGLVAIFIVIKHHDNVVAQHVPELNIKMGPSGGKYSQIGLIPNPKKNHSFTK